MAKMFQELQRHSPVKFDLVFLAMDPGYHPSIKRLLIENCEYLNIPLTIFDSQIFEVADKIAGDYPCYMCARMRRGAHVCFTEAFHIRQMTDTLLRPQKELILMWL